MQFKNSRWISWLGHRRAYEHSGAARAGDCGAEYVRCSEPLAVYKIGSQASALLAYVRRLRWGSRHGPPLISSRFRQRLAAHNNNDTYV